MLNRPDANRRDARPAAFTLVEMVIVVATIAMVSAIAVPRYANSIARYRTDLAAKRLVADLALARMSARTGSASRTVTFTTASSAYVLAGVTPLNGGAGNYTVQLTHEPYHARLTSATFGSTNPPAVVFDRFGNPSTAGVVVIASGQFTRTVSLSADTGKASIQ